MARNGLKKNLAIGVSVCAIIGAVATAWIQLGFPLPASAEDVKKLTKKQAQIGIALYRDRERTLRRERQKLQWDTSSAQQSNAPPAQVQMMQDQTEELKIKEQDAADERKQFERQYINAEQ